MGRPVIDRKQVTYSKSHINPGWTQGLSPKATVIRSASNLGGGEESQNIFEEEDIGWWGSYHSISSVNFNAPLHFSSISLSPSSFEIMNLLVPRISECRPMYCMRLDMSHAILTVRPIKAPSPQSFHLTCLLYISNQISTNIFIWLLQTLGLVTGSNPAVLNLDFMSLPLGYGKADGLDICLSPVTAKHGASSTGQYQCSRLGVSQAKSVYTSPAETQLL